MNITWKGYEWMNGQPWGEAHPDKTQLWYADETEAIKIMCNDNIGILLDINNNPRYFPDIDQTKPFGCGCISTVETFLYGHFHFEYILPIGIHLWPAIWLSGADDWPPEIDIVEGWSGNGYFIKNQPNYKKFIGFNYIHPGVYYGKDSEGNVLGKGFGSLGTKNTTYQCYQKLNHKLNTCDLYWYPDHVKAYYNNHLVMDITEKEILDGLNGRMYICMDSWIWNNFSQKDFENYKTKGSPFVITDFKYGK